MVTAPIFWLYFDFFCELEVQISKFDKIPFTSRGLEA